MNKIYITNHVKLEILNTCGLATMKPYNLNGSITLLTLGFNTEQQYEILENKLRSIAVYYNTGKKIIPNTISADFTINQCVELVMLEIV
jgi:hypothetical protein